MKKFSAIITMSAILGLTACSTNTDLSPENSGAYSDLSTKIVSPLLSDEGISESDIETVKNTYNSEYETVYDAKVVDLDFDGQNELLVLAAKVNARNFDVWKKDNDGMTRENSFGSGKVNSVDKISLKKAEINGEGAYLFSFSYDEGNSMKADEVLSAIRKTSDGYDVEHLLSRGTITYSDIAEPFTKEFYRRGWSKYDIGLDTDYGDIAKEEYDRLYKQYTGGEISDGFTNESTPAAGSEIAAQFEVPGGEPVDLTNAVVHGFNGDVTLSEMTADNWNYVTCDYVYLAEPLGICYNSVDNSDIFDENEMAFTGAPETAAYKYKKYKVGDMFGSLKLTEASTSFCPEWSNLNPRYFNGGSARFEGKLTLTGKCYLYPVTEGYDYARDIHFIPDGQSAKLPIMNYSQDENGNEALGIGMSNGFCWLSEYFPSIVLGNANYYPNFDFGEFPDDGSLVDVKVTIDNIYFRNELNFSKGFSASLVDLEVIQ